MSGDLIPVFPLNTPLLPGCKMPLQIFEQRYLDMVSSCMKAGTGFVVALLEPGSETREVIRPGETAQSTPPFYPLGTQAQIVDFGQRENGLLAITIEGSQRQDLSGIHQQADGLWLAQGEPRPESGQAGRAELEELTDLLDELMIVNGLSEYFGDGLTGEQVMNYLIMLLPIPVPTKQQLIQCDDHQQRWTGLRRALTELVQSQSGSGH